MVLGHSNFFITSEKTIQYHSILVSLHFLHFGFSTVAKFTWIWDSFKSSKLQKNMGGTASSQSTGPDGQIKNNEAQNYGLINVSAENSNLSSWLEVATCAGVIIVILYIALYLCQKRQQRKRARFHAALQSVRVQPEIARIPMFPIERAPVSPAVSSPPPDYQAAYPNLAKSSAEAKGAEIMNRYL